MDKFQAALEPAKQFSKDCVRLMYKCNKPSRKEYKKVAIATAVGFGLMGFIGFFLKLVHIPINHLLVSR